MMAKRRMIWKKISTSVQVNEMSEFAQLLFTWMIPHADDYGVMKAHPKFLKAEVMPLSSRNFNEFQDALDEMVNADLIVQYDVDGEGSLIQFKRWEDHQTGLSRRTRTGKLPRFIDFQRNSQKFTEIHPEQNRTEQEQNGTEQEKVAATFSSIWLEELNTLDLNATLAEEMDAYIGEITADFFTEAVREMLRQGKRSWKYCKAIIDNCVAEGRSPGEKGKRGSERVKHPEYAEALKERATKRRRETGAETG